MLLVSGLQAIYPVLKEIPSCSCFPQDCHCGFPVAFPHIVPFFLAKIWNKNMKNVELKYSNRNLTFVSRYVVLSKEGFASLV
jgi:hypothetical protein